MTRGIHVFKRAMLMTVIFPAAGLVATGCGSTAPNAAATNKTSGPTSSLSGTPIEIGYSNTEGKGASSYPTETVGVDAAVKWVNDHGGINGHELKLDKCLNDGTPAGSVSCANQFVAHKDPAVLVGTDLGVDAMVPVLTSAGIPAFAALLQGAKAQTSVNFFQAGPPFTDLFSTTLNSLAEQGVRRFAFIGPNGVPVTNQVFDIIKPMASKLGMSANLVTFDAASPNFSSVLAALNANDIDGAFLGAGDEQCNQFVQAATSIAYKKLVVLNACSQFLSKFGAKAEGFETVQEVYPPEARQAAPKAKQADIDQYLAGMKDAGAEPDLSSLLGYASTIDMANVLGSVPGKPTAETMMKEFKSLSNFDAFDGDTLDCANRTAAQGASCDSEMLVLKATSEGTLDVVGGGYSAPPTS